MTPARLIAIGFIYCCCAVAWSVLGGTIVSRTGESDSRLAQEVAQLWGGRHNQVAPTARVDRPRVVVEDVKDNRGLKIGEIKKTVIDEIPVALDSSRINASLALDHRRKGLLWYATYAVDFKATYRIHNPDAEARHVVVKLAFPSAQGIYDGFTFRVNGSSAGPLTDLAQGVTAETQLAPGQEALVEVAYRSRGLSDWTYSFVSSGVAQVSDFTLTLDTNFAGVDFPAGTISPTRKEETPAGWRLTWRFDSLAAGQRIGVEAPNRLNPGPLASRITFFAPVGLLFFLTVMVIVGVMERRSLHPMNYFFLAAAFFAFHLLLAYLVDHLDLHASFAIAALVSVLLVVSYLRVVAGVRAALLQAGAAQLVFLVLFSYAFFFEGYTGLAVTIGAVLTLFVLMQVTARLDWADVLARREVPPQAR
jgi:inner membrane protein involved in colicin E2 resistance